MDEALEYLRIKSQDLDTLATDPAQGGVNILLKPSDSTSKAFITLDLIDVPLGEALRYVTELANLKMSVQPFAALVADSFPAPSSPSPDLKPAVMPKSGAIIISRIEFHDAPITECLDFIRLKSRELDPDKKGVNIILKPGGDKAPLVTLSLKDVPVFEALRYCAELSSHKLTTDGPTFLLTPTTDTK